MRYSQDHKAQTYQRIVKEASARFRRDGIGATGLQPLMKALGLTHGGFYAHFKSKDDLVETALRDASEESANRAVETFAKPDALNSFIDMYLSQAHRENPDRGCPLPTMAAELGQRGTPSATADEAVQRHLTRLAAALGGDDADARSVMMLSSLVGALLLSRSVQDPALSDRILNTVREALKHEAQA
ncbi:TetR/AcrR family transcriptional regulator [Pseudomonas sp. HR96]|uniref:TetR/AcrR family transcriptional regulator n=1 Tax=Pseudomonas sp. HR96 TaxID=1027966 RepID=UPI002A7528B8|nr:TetR/AcrR family transcriptional regulator [Pseudomonas sp. HR96]WPO98850.1 TetR/AcrR family transcriptional regulator [Pseudomonas sp. HR96]